MGRNKAWINREWMNNAALLQPCPNSTPGASRITQLSCDSSGCGWDKAEIGNAQALEELSEPCHIPIPVLV